MAVEKHECPAPACTLQIDNRLFCCAKDWFRLSQSVRVRIGATAKMSVLARPRRSAIEDALGEWREQDAARTGG